MPFYKNIFDSIISLENLFSAWEEFRKGKSQRVDVSEFGWNIEEYLLHLHRELVSRKYKHGLYTAFTICDPKQRRIHKASVRDRVLHHAMFKVLNPIFEPIFYAHSYSCRRGKGTHRAVTTLERWLRRVSGNGRGPCFALKCDIHRFFASVDHDVLLSLLGRKVVDPDALWLLSEIIGSFSPRGLPIGNLTSQLFANVYMNELDQFVKHELRVKHYVRYTDDFVFVAPSRRELEQLMVPIQDFLRQRLKLELHPGKVHIRKYRQGIDFLGYVLLPHHRVLRTKTKRRIFRRVHRGITEQALQSYLGVLSHANTHGLAQKLLNQHWLSASTLPLRVI